MNINVNLNHNGNFKDSKKQTRISHIEAIVESSPLPQNNEYTDEFLQQESGCKDEVVNRIQVNIKGDASQNVTIQQNGGGQSGQTLKISSKLVSFKSPKSGSTLANKQTKA